MAEESRRQRGDEGPLTFLWRSDIGKRLVGLTGLAIIVGAVIGILFAAGGLGGQGGGTTESGVPIQDAVVLEPPPPPGISDFDVGPSVGKVAPDFELSRMEDGSRLKLSDFRGRPVFINFWATWCIPCRVEMPDIKELMNRHPELVVIGINRAEPLGRAERFLESIELKDGSKGMSFTVNGMDPNDALYNEYRGLGMPVSVFVDANGVVTFVWNGLLTLPVMEEALSQTLASAPVTTGESAAPNY